MNKNKTFLNSSILPLFLGFFLFFILISAVHAGCPELRLYATNKLPITCYLTDRKEEHGDMGTSSEQNLLPDGVEREHGRGDQSSAWGPDFRYWYSCGGWGLYVRGQKNFCSSASGDISFQVEPQGTAGNALSITNKWNDKASYCFLCSSHNGETHFTLEAVDPGEELNVTTPTATQIANLNEKFTWTVSSTKDLGFGLRGASTASAVVLDNTLTIPATSCARDGSTNNYNCEATWTHPAEVPDQQNENHTWKITTLDSIYSAGTDGRTKTFSGPDFTTKAVVVRDLKIAPDPANLGKFMLEGDYDKPAAFDIKSDADNYVEIADERAPDTKYKIQAAFRTGCLVDTDCYFNIPLSTKVPSGFLIENHTYTINTSFNYVSGGATTLVQQKFTTMMADNGVSIDESSVKKHKLGMMSILHGP